MTDTTAAQRALIFQQVVEIAENIGGTINAGTSDAIEKLGINRHFPFYIDQINGSNDAVGNEGNPLLTVNKALALQPRNSSSQVSFVSDYNSSNRVISGASSGKRILLIGSGAQRRLSYDLYINKDDDGNDLYHMGHSIDISGNNTVDISCLNLEFGFNSLSDLIDPDLGVHVQGSSFFRSAQSTSPSTINLEFTKCHFDCPEDAVGHLIGSNKSIINLQLNDCTWTEHMDGHWAVGFDAGTDTVGTRINSTKRYL